MIAIPNAVTTAQIVYGIIGGSGIAVGLLSIIMVLLPRRFKEQQAIRATGRISDSASRRREPPGPTVSA